MRNVVPFLALSCITSVAVACGAIADAPTNPESADAGITSDAAGRSSDAGVTTSPRPSQTPPAGRDGGIAIDASTSASDAGSSVTCPAQQASGASCVQQGQHCSYGTTECRCIETAAGSNLLWGCTTQ